MRKRGLGLALGLAVLAIAAVACGRGEESDQPQVLNGGVVAPAQVPAPTAPPAPVLPRVEPVVAPQSAPAPRATAGQASSFGSGSASSLLQSAGGQAGIWVTGRGSVALEPDLAQVNVGVETQAKTVADARAQASLAMADIVAAVKAHGLVDKDVQTRSFNIYPRYDFIERRQVLQGYTVSNTATIKVRDIDAVGEIIDDVAEAGGDATRINGVSFTVEDPTPFMSDLREMAVADALGKAAHFGALTGVSVGKLVFISEQGGSVPRVQDFGGPQIAFAEARSVPTTSISGGELELTLSIQAVFEIQ